MQAYTCIICLRLAFRMACDSELLAVMATRSCLYPDRRLLQGAVWTCCREVVEGQSPMGGALLCVRVKEGHGAMM
jgi:hypothetical protein